MKNLPESGGPDPLRKLLQEWKPDTTLPPGFQTAVWNRIDEVARQPGRGPSLLHAIRVWLDQFVARPQLAVAYIVLLATIGMTAGWTQGQSKVARVQEGLAERYVQTLDPYQAPRR